MKRHAPRISPVALATTLLLVAACGQGSFGSDIARHDDYVSGKADAYGACESTRALAFVNDPATTAEVLKGVGVRSRARRNILTHRDGPDGVAGTADDDLFDTLAELDAIRYVGPATLQKIVRAGVERAGGCAPASAGKVEVVFSPQPWGESHLARVVDRIEAARETIDVAMYSLSDGTVIQALEAAARRGVSIRLLFNKAAEDRKSPAGTLSARLEDAGVDVRWINKTMHHKFAIFDGPRRDPALATRAEVVTGSGNWSYSAGTRYDENTLFVEGNAELTLRLQKEFDHLWNNSRDFAWNPSIVSEFGAAVDDAAIAAVDTEAVDSAFTSANFTTYDSSRYGPTFKVVRGSDTVADRLVALIAGARRQILIASGHLRSRPVVEALLAKHASDPGVEIRILLDNQEYISASYDAYQRQQLQWCLDDARTETQRSRCYDRGFLYSYQVHSAGIPVRFKTYAYRWHYSYAVQMHHKFMVVDGKTLVTGSYNLSDNAEHNTMENMLFFDAQTYPDLVAAYILNFETLWNLGRSEGRYEAFLDEVRNGTGRRIDIVFTPMTLEWQQVTDLKAAIRAACSDVDSSAFRSEPEAHRTCTRR